jgi:hypothetical protein
VTITAIAGKIALAVDASAVVANRRVAHPKKAGAREAPVVNFGNLGPVDHAFLNPSHGFL